MTDKVDRAEVEAALAVFADPSAPYVGEDEIWNAGVTLAAALRAAEAERDEAHRRFGEATLFIDKHRKEFVCLEPERFKGLIACEDEVGEIRGSIDLNAAKAGHYDEMEIALTTTLESEANLRAQLAEARLAEIQAAHNEYLAALERREHGGVACAQMRDAVVATLSRIAPAGKGEG